ncbi:hypothetical protein [Nocardia stercoris]|uniref:Uncharacterized protein n=1 Tax=Nocardia stercoris TaxID=2483361 RepID=A0A3M2L0E7_9NOCA|nr:hypothetical protein [Nocardia stercoris]RMI30864.1 hypothetical protein EBN03_19655 [Nocardia stercoris]
MTRTRWILADLTVLIVGVAAALVCSRLGVRTSEFPAVGDQPAFTATRYVGPWLGSAAALGTLAGVALIDLCDRLLNR